MKYEILKRTAIALFVGSVVSTYSVAEGSTSAKSSVEDVLNTINKNSKDISKVTKDVSDLAKTLKGEGENPGLLGALEEANNGIKENKEALAATDDKVKELAGDVKKNREDLIEAAGAVKDLQDGVSDLHEVVYGPKGKPEEGLVDIVTKHNDTIYGTEGDPDSGLVHVVDKHSEIINDLKRYNHLDDVKALVENKADKQALEDLKKEVSTNSEAITSVSDQVEENHNSIENVREEHYNLVSDVKKFVEDYNKFADDTNKELDDKANASEVYTKTESDSKLNAKANASDVYTKTESDRKLNAKANVADVYSKTETDNKFALKADNSVVRAQAEDIRNLRTDVNAHTKRLDHLDNRVNKLDKDLKRGLAAQAALTGLFQPYTVGKANFTAAVGGYKSQTAVAIGTGYRYNQNIATKAGVAFTQGGGVTYNAGVNFEW